MTNSNTSVQPYLFFNGRCEEALEFYRSALGAEVEMLSRFKDAPEPGTQPGMENKVMHASFRIGETVLMASDGRCDGQPRFDGFSLSIVVPDEDKAESLFNALADGGKVTMPLEKTFWAPKFGMLEDRFGVGWYPRRDAALHAEGRRAGGIGQANGSEKAHAGDFAGFSIGRCGAGAESDRDRPHSRQDRLKHRRGTGALMAAQRVDLTWAAAI
jgi:PhnB protein